MKARASHNSYRLAIWAMPVVCVLLWVATASSQMIDVYQWTDSNGIINFTDNLKSVPEALRDSPALILRKDLFVHETVQTPVAQQEVTQETRREPNKLRSYPVEFKPTIIYSPQTTTNIAVYNSGVSQVRRRYFPVYGRHGRSFKRKSKGIQYIHPEARSGRRIQYIHPEAFRQPRLSHRRGFAARQNFHSRSITGRRR